MQENHTFDNYFGAYPGADGRPPGVCMPNDLADPSKGCVKPSPPRLAGGARPRPQPDGVRRAVRQRADGWLRRRLRAPGQDRGAADGLLRRPRRAVLLQRRRQLRPVRPLLLVRPRRQPHEPRLLGDGRAGRHPQRLAPAGRPREPADHLRPPAGGRRLVEVLRPELRPDEHLPHARERRPRLAERVGAAAHVRPLPRRPGAVLAHLRTSASTTWTPPPARCPPSPSSPRPGPASTRPGGSRPGRRSCARSSAS